MVKLSIVTTMYQSAAYVREFYARTVAAANQITPSFEIVFVNDGSFDESLDLAVQLFREDPRVRVIDLSRNFGEHKAMMTGLGYARGELVFLLDGDLEEAPEVLNDFYPALLSRGADVIYGVQRRRKGGVSERVLGSFFYTAFNLLAHQKIPRNVVTARLMTRRYVDALVAHRESEVFIFGLWSIAGFLQVGLPVDKASKGTTTYTLRRKLILLVNAVTSFSNAPLWYVFCLGSLGIIVAGAYGFYLFIIALFFGREVPGWTSLMVSIWLLGGMIMFSIGVVGIYISKIFSETKNRPYTIVRQIYESETNSPAALMEDHAHKPKFSTSVNG